MGTIVFVYNKRGSVCIKTQIVHDFVGNFQPDFPHAHQFYTVVTSQTFVVLLLTLH